MSLLVSLLSGALFGTGLVLSGLINPAKVLAFLDITGAWDPSLAATMAVAVLVTAVGYRLSFAAGRPALDRAFHLPTQSDIDLRLVSGAALFGIGWGLVGYCPGPAIAALALGTPATFIFVAAMLAGMAAARALQRIPASASLPHRTITKTDH
jgi:uncharacterized membrane protein YedE/YeeE